MLVLCRTINESIVIGDEVEVTVISTSLDKVELHIHQLNPPAGTEQAPAPDEPSAQPPAPRKVVLSPDESIEVAPGVGLKVVRALTGRVYLGFSAPAQVRVHRREIYDAIRTDGPKRPTGNP